MSDKPIIAVYAHNVDRPILIGYAIGSAEDIEAYFDDQKAYGLELKTVRPITIPKGYAAERKELIARKERLEEELRQLNDEIANPKR